MQDHCDKCQRPLEPGALRFKVRMLIYGDTGDTLPDQEGSPCPEQSLSEVMDQALAMSDRELMEGVAEELAFVLCPPCRAALRADPAGGRTMPAPLGRVVQ